MAGDAARRQLQPPAAARPASGPADRTPTRRLEVPVSRSLPPAAVRVIRDALTEARDAGITEPAAAAQHAASALIAHGWYVTGRPTPKAEDR